MGSWHPLFFIYIFIFNKISLLFHLFFFYLTCSCPYSYNLMLTASCMCRPYIYSYYPIIIRVVLHYDHDHDGPLRWSVIQDLFTINDINFSFMRDHECHLCFLHLYLISIFYPNKVVTYLFWSPTNTINFFRVSEWLLFNANSVIFKLYHVENSLFFNKMMMRLALH